MAFRFTPGQVAVLSVPGEAPAYFAFASAPDDRELEVLVKQKVGASNVIFDMKPGEKIELVDCRRSRISAGRTRGKRSGICRDGNWRGAIALRAATRVETKE